MQVLKNLNIQPYALAYGEKIYNLMGEMFDIIRAEWAGSANDFRYFLPAAAINLLKQHICRRELTAYEYTGVIIDMKFNDILIIPGYELKIILAHVQCAEVSTLPFITHGMPPL